MANLEILLQDIQREAERETVPIDHSVYESHGLNPTRPILYAGNLQSQICFFARDLGRDEVKAQQPLYGAAGSMVRQGFFWAMYHRYATNLRELQTVCDRLLLTNTMPYKPPGNKAYTGKIKERFRPFVAQFLVCHWGGSEIITLGTEAFKWYAPYGDPGVVEAFWQRGDRYEAQLEVTLKAIDDQGIPRERPVRLYPLPHPSPLNKRFYHKFPAMLQHRLNQMPF